MKTFSKLSEANKVNMIRELSLVTPEFSITTPGGISEETPGEAGTFSSSLKKINRIGGKLPPIVKEEEEESIKLSKEADNN